MAEFMTFEPKVVNPGEPIVFEEQIEEPERDKYMYSYSIIYECKSSGNRRTMYGKIWAYDMYEAYDILKRRTWKKFYDPLKQSDMVIVSGEMRGPI